MAPHPPVRRRPISLGGMGSGVALRVGISVSSGPPTGLGFGCSWRAGHVGHGEALVGDSGCGWWRGALCQITATVLYHPVGWPISSQDMGSEVALDVGIDVDGWAGGGGRMDCSRVGHVGSGGASVGVVGCQ